MPVIRALSDNMSIFMGSLTVSSRRRDKRGLVLSDRQHAHSVVCSDGSIQRRRVSDNPQDILVPWDEYVATPKEFIATETIAKFALAYKREIAEDLERLLDEELLN